MKKLTLIGLKRDANTVMETLHYLNCVEIKETEAIESATRFENSDRIDEINEKLSRLESCIEAVNLAVAERRLFAKKNDELTFEPPKKPLFFCRRDVSFNEFMLIATSEIELSAVMDEIDAEVFTQNDIRSRAARLTAEAEQLTAFAGLEFPFSLAGNTKHSVVKLGQIPFSQCADFMEKIVGGDLAYGEILSKNSVACVVAVCCHRDNADAVSEILSEVGFTECPFAYDEDARSRIAYLQKQLADMERDRVASVVRLTEKTTNLDDLKLLYDYYVVTKSKIECTGGFMTTDATFVLQAWIPANTAKTVTDTLQERAQAIVTFIDDPAPGDEVPSLTKNVKLVTPYESVTNLYSPPKYKEVDPNLFVGIFFFLFFGIMLSDAGYGLVLTIATLVILRCFKLETNFKKMVLVICMGGVSTIIWGAVLGTWFGVDATNIPILKNLMWFNPISDPVKMLIMCLLLGIVQILFGMGIKAYALIKDGKWHDAIFDVFSWYLFFIGIGIAILPMVMGLPDILTIVGACVAGSGLLIVLFTNGRHKKGIFGKITGGLSGLYNIVNFLGDILSYARLFGLGIATGIIGYAMNILAGLVMGQWYTIPFAVLILLVGHTFNLAINLLGAYIHNSRLQFIEFFSKFYEGGGEEFRPLGYNTSYVKIK